LPTTRKILVAPLFQ